MITIARQGIGSAVVHVPLTVLTDFAPLATFVDSDAATKAVAKQAAVAFMQVNSTWSTGRTVATRATLHADGKHYTVIVRHYTK